MSEFAMQVLDWYTRGLWKPYQVERVYSLGKLTEEEYNTIKGETNG